MLLLTEEGGGASSTTPTLDADSDCAMCVYGVLGGHLSCRLAAKTPTPGPVQFWYYNNIIIDMYGRCSGIANQSEKSEMFLGVDSPPPCEMVQLESTANSGMHQWLTRVPHGKEIRRHKASCRH